MLSGIEKIIAGLPSSLTVLDVGGFGLDGENTSLALAERFTQHRYTCMNTDARSILACKERFMQCKTLEERFFDYEFQENYGVVVIDMWRGQNQEFWDDDQLLDPYIPVEMGGYVIAYVMHPKNFLFVNRYEESYKLVAIEQEQRRPEIHWVCLQKL